jgi:penicillin-binding protein 1A
MFVRIDGERPGGWWIPVRWAAYVGLIASLGALLAGVAIYQDHARSLPDFDRLTEYRPPVVTRIVSQTGQVIGELYREKREVVPYEHIPPKLAQAFVASEDDRFFEHAGIDPFGILRAAIANLKAGRVVQGGSTITQQVAKSILIAEQGYREGSARNITRKIREAILARRLEAHFDKATILARYLNHIFLGNQSYGVQAAAQNYFRKDVRDLNLAEMALLAGLPQAPSRYSPFAHPAEARERREYVLRRMVEEGYITPSEWKAAEATPIRVYRAPNLIREVVPYFAEQVRRDLSDRFDDDTLLTQGLTVHTTVDVERYRMARDAVYENLRKVDKRQGFRGPLLQLDRSEWDGFLRAYQADLDRSHPRGRLHDDTVYLGLVTDADPRARQYRVRIGSHTATLPLAGMRWARRPDPQVIYSSALLNRLPLKRLGPGDVVLVRPTDPKALREQVSEPPLRRTVPRQGRVVELEQEPSLETALLSQDPRTGYVLAMLGGYDFERSEFNRALQACRQPGSSFKPLVYAAAIDLKDMHASSILLDAPLAFNDASAQNRWKPSNFDSKFQGEVTLRTALKDSMNVPSVRVLAEVGIRRAIRYAHRLGIESDLRPELGLALGSSCVTMGELMQVYSMFAHGGQRVPRRFITRIENRDGEALLDQGHPNDVWAPWGRRLRRALRQTRSPADQVVSPQVAYLVGKLMRNVVQEGTGRPARKLGVPIAGKTGTTNDSFDAWFVGFNPSMATAVWVGFDDYALPMGRYEQGGRAALPIWVDYMDRAMKGEALPFVAPPGIVTVSVDRKTGKRTAPDAPGSVEEAFLRSQVPTEYVAQDGKAEPDSFFMLDN